MPSENVAPTELVPPDRRQRKREARRDHLLDLASDLVERDGVAGITMAALAEASDHAPSSLYTYFSSHSALVAAVQHRALVSLGTVADRHLAVTAALVTEPTEPGARRPAPRVAALARLCSFADLFLAAPQRHPREFRLQQELLVAQGIEDVADIGDVLPAALRVLEAPRCLLQGAAELGALQADGPAADPLGEPMDPAFARTLTWVLAMNGALLADGLITGLPTTGAAIGAHLTDALLVGWGANRAHLDAARTLSTSWALDTVDPAGEPS